MKRRLRDSSSYYTDLPDGSVSLTVLRRTGRDQYAGGWEELLFEGDADDAVEAQYADYCSMSGDRSERQAARRTRWGPLGTGKLS